MGLTRAAVNRFRSASLAVQADIFAGHLDTFGETALFGTLSITVVFVDPMRGFELIEGGIAPDGELFGRCLASAVAGALPAVGSRVRWQERSYQVVTFTVRTGHPIAEFRLRPSR